MLMNKMPTINKAAIPYDSSNDVDSNWTKINTAIIETMSMILETVSLIALFIPTSLNGFVDSVLTIV